MGLYQPTDGAVLLDGIDLRQLDPADVRRHITPRTRAIMPVHLYGQACDMAALMAIASEHRLFVVEDCAEAFYLLDFLGHFTRLMKFSRF